MVSYGVSMSIGNPASAESRIIRLEETVWFQEDKLRSLEAHILAQQAQIDAMERQIEELKAAFLHLRHMPSSGQEGSAMGGHERPPHYAPERWR